MQDRHIVALDLDGTVLDHGYEGAGDGAEDGHIDPDLGQAIRTLHESGHEVIIATGRSVEATLRVVERLKIRPEWVIASNGAITLKRDPLGDRGFRREYVEAFNPSEVLQELRPQLLTAHFSVELTSGEFLYTQPIPSGTLPSRRRQVPFDELLHVQATRLLIFSDEHQFDAYFDTVDEIGLSHVTYGVGTMSWLDIAPTGVSKASALETLRARLDISPSNVFAAGDGSNDVTMLQWAARMGDSVALGQALPDVKAAAKRTTATVGEGGLLLALQQRFPDLLGS